MSMRQRSIIPKLLQALIFVPKNSEQAGPSVAPFPALLVLLTLSSYFSCFEIAKPLIRRMEGIQFHAEQSLKLVHWWKIYQMGLSRKTNTYAARVWNNLASAHSHYFGRSHALLVPLVLIVLAQFALIFLTLRK